MEDVVVVFDLLPFSFTLCKNHAVSSQFHRFTEPLRVCTLVYYSSIYSSRDLWPYMVLPRTVIIDTQSVSTHIFIIYVVMTPGHVHHVKVNYISIFLL